MSLRTPYGMITKALLFTSAPPHRRSRARSRSAAAASGAVRQFQCASGPSAPRDQPAHVLRFDAACAAFNRCAVARRRFVEDILRRHPHSSRQGLRASRRRQSIPHPGRASKLAAAGRNACARGPPCTRRDRRCWPCRARRCGSRRHSAHAAARARWPSSERRRRAASRSSAAKLRMCALGHSSECPGASGPRLGITANAASSSMIRRTYGESREQARDQVVARIAGDLAAEATVLAARHVLLPVVPRGAPSRVANETRRRLVVLRKVGLLPKKPRFTSPASMRCCRTPPPC